ncbi:LacI family DNA-binding transcriptional regulator [Affinibrenneria salicis]|uniref:LacI family DNA-binding transcriptional regulator n=1 Tax=Affinibrenneria salicis TaxID=2590031 RepID=A0A5J5FXS3_9GAMM|nr:substrate-binding domain-containing protein [Affinibrenneria salicis]KAA8998904.1 LacI family DNA-binding transcriptional regulator [Affinibrenneria salicis]
MSLKKIAEQLGLSITTVSRALNGYDDVAIATRERIVACAKSLGYQPNALARRLKMGKTDAIGLVYPSRPRVLNNSTFLEMIGGISLELARHGVDLLLIPDAPGPGHAQTLEHIVETRRVDALLVAHTQPEDKRLRYLCEQNFPFLALGRSRLDHPYAWFDFDNAAGSALAVQRLRELGHQRIAFIGTQASLSYVEQRLDGFCRSVPDAEALRAAGYILTAESDRRGGFLAARRLLALPEPPTAIVTDSNMLGDGAASALQQANLLDEQGVSLISYDGLPDDSLVTVAVTPIIQATRTSVGRQISEMVLALLSGTPLEQLQVLWQPTLGSGQTDHPPHD